MARITSLQNPKIKDIERLRSQKSSYWKDCFLVEGFREVMRALAENFVLVELFVDESSCLGSQIAELNCASNFFEPTMVSSQVFAKLAMREGTVTVVAVFKQRTYELENWQSGHRSPLFLAVQSIEKPGNFGALLRTSDGAGVDGVISLGAGINPYHHNVVRTSTGAIFRVPVYSTSEKQFLDFCRSHSISIIAATPDAEAKYYDIDLTKPTCVLLGAEDKGLSDFWRSGLVQTVRIPMLGICDSLNVSVAGALLLYECMKQRDLINKAQK